MTQTVFIIFVSIYAGTMTLIPIGMFLWELRVVFFAGYTRFVFIHPDTKRQYAFMRRIDPSATTVEFLHGMYGLDKDCVTYSGKYRIPTFNYIEGIAEPYNVFTMDFSKKISAIDFKNVAKNVAMKQLLMAMMMGALNPVNLMLAVLIVVILGFVAIGGYSYSEFSTIKEAMGIVK